MITEEALQKALLSGKHFKCALSNTIKDFNTKNIGNMVVIDIVTNYFPPEKLDSAKGLYVTISGMVYKNAIPINEDGERATRLIDRSIKDKTLFNREEYEVQRTSDLASQTLRTNSIEKRMQIYARLTYANMHASSKKRYICALLKAGMTKQEIAGDLGLCMKTVNAYISK